MRVFFISYSTYSEAEYNSEYFNKNQNQNQISKGLFISSKNLKLRSLSLSNFKCLQVIIQEL